MDTATAVDTTAMRAALAPHTSQTSTYVESRFETLAALCDVIETSRDVTEDTGWAPVSYNSSITSSERFAPRSLDNMLAACRHPDRSIHTTVEEIARLTDTLVSGKLPPTTTYKRQRIWGRSGNTVNIHRVNRGQVNHAWRRSVRTRQLGHSGVMTLCLPCSWSASISTDQIHWSLVAGLALADYIERQGRRCDIWLAMYGVGTFDATTHPPYHWLAALHMKPAHAPWDATGAAYAADPSFLRRILFRLAEMTTLLDPHRALASRYGRPAQSHAPLKTWAAAQSWPVDTILFGPAQHDAAVQSFDQAETWLQTAIAALDATD